MVHGMMVNTGLARLSYLPNSVSVIALSPSHSLAAILKTETLHLGMFFILNRLNSSATSDEGYTGILIYTIDYCGSFMYFFHLVSSKETSQPRHSFNPKLKWRTFERAEIPTPSSPSMKPCICAHNVCTIILVLDSFFNYF